MIEIASEIGIEREKCIGRHKIRKEILSETNRDKDINQISKKGFIFRWIHLAIRHTTKKESSGKVPPEQKRFRSNGYECKCANCAHAYISGLGESPRMVIEAVFELRRVS